jgi:hypothetical protein
VRYEVKQNASFYSVDSEEGAWNTGRVEEGGNLANKTPTRAATSPSRPSTRRPTSATTSAHLIESGLILERAHHEVGTGGQQEINYRFDTMVHAADDILKFKYIVKNVAEQWGKVATFMPKPLFGDNGSGMHTHQSLWLDGKPSSTTRRATAACPTSPAGTSAACSRTRRRARLHQPDAELLQAPGEGLRGAGQPGLLGRQPLAAIRIPITGATRRPSASSSARRTPRATRTSPSRRR